MPRTCYNLIDGTGNRTLLCTKRGRSSIKTRFLLWMTSISKLKMHTNSTMDSSRPIIINSSGRAAIRPMRNDLRSMQPPRWIWLVEVWLSQESHLRSQQDLFHRVFMQALNAQPTTRPRLCSLTAPELHLSKQLLWAQAAKFLGHWQLKSGE